MKHSFWGTRRKKNKYRAIKTQINDIVFDSRKEAQHYQKLQLMKQTGAVLKFETHKKFPLVVNGKNCGNYIADFVEHYPDGKVIVRDIKGFDRKTNSYRQTPLFRFKKKVFEALYGTKIIFS